jgi:hypothetical protein
MIKRLIAGAASLALALGASLWQQLRHRRSAAHLATTETPGAGPSPTRPATRQARTRP